MADVKITDLALKAVPDATDLLVIVDDPGGAPVTKKTTVGGALTLPLGWYDSSSWASINAAVAAIGATETTLVVSTAETQTANIALTFPSTLSLIILKGGSIIKNGTSTVIINGPFEAGLYQVFSGFSGSDIVFGGGSIIEFYPQWWGAIGDYNTDDTAAIQTMLDVGVATLPTYGIRSPTVFNFGSNQYGITAALTYTTTDASGYTVFKGNYSKTYIYQKTAATETLIITKSGGAAIYGIFLDGIFFSSDSTGAATVPSVQLISPYISKVKDCYFDGGYSGLQIEGGSQLEITNCRFEGFAAGGADNAMLNIIGNSAYIRVNNCQFTGSTTTQAIRIKDSSIININGGQIDTTEKGILLDNSDYINIEGMILKTVDINGIEGINGSNYNVVHGNIFNGSMNAAIYVDSDGNGGDGWIINDNKIDSVVDGITLGAAANKNIVKGNSLSNYSGTPITYALSDNIIRDNLLSVNHATFADGDTTPSVMTNHSYYTTANTNPTTITMLNNGWAGQRVTILMGDSQTTWDFTGTHLKGNAGVDWTPAGADWLECVFDGTDWYCSVHDCTS